MAESERLRSAGVLDGIRVLDLTRVVAGPYATLMLADHGADVTKVEPPAGDESRAAPRRGRASAALFDSLNRNKQSIVLDLSLPEEREELLAHVACADVVIDNFRPDARAKLRIEREHLLERNDQIVTCSISAFGTSSAAFKRGGVDSVLQAFSGIMSATGSAESGPTKAGPPMVDYLGGMAAACGITLALFDRARTGLGRHVEISLAAVAMSVMAPHLLEVSDVGVEPEPVGNGSWFFAPTGTFECRDGRLLTLSLFSNRHFERFAAEVGLADVLNDPRFSTNESRVRHRKLTHQLVSDAMVTRDSSDWLRLLLTWGVPVSPVQSVGEAFQASRKLAPEMFLEGPLIASPIAIDGYRGQYRYPPPGLGEQSEQLRSTLTNQPVSGGGRNQSIDGTAKP